MNKDERQIILKSVCECNQVILELLDRLDNLLKLVENSITDEENALSEDECKVKIQNDFDDMQSYILKFRRDE